MGGCLFVFASLQISPLAGTWPANPPGRTTNVVLPKEQGSEGLNTKPKKAHRTWSQFFGKLTGWKVTAYFKAHVLELQFLINPCKDFNPF